MVSRALQIEFTISTRGAGLYEFTGDVCRWMSSVAGDGLLTLFVRHTSCSLLIQENADPEVQTDLHAFFERLVPPEDATGFVVRQAAESARADRFTPR